MQRRTFLNLTAVAVCGGALAACGGSSPPAPRQPAPEPPLPVQATIGWNRVALTAILATATPPTIASRILAIVHTAMFNAWAAYDPVALSTRHGATLRRPLAERTPANQVKAFSFAAWAALRDVLPSQQAAFDAHLAALGYDASEASPDFTLAQGVGMVSAAAVLAWAHGDGANQLGTLTASGIPYADYSGYLAVNAPLAVDAPTPRSAIAAPSHWQPLAYRDAAGALRVQGFLTPFWGSLRPFALASGSQYRPAPPALYGTSAYEDQVRTMVEVQRNLSDTQKVMVEYWAGGPAGELPSSYWSQFAAFISRRDNHSEGADIKLFFALANALFDAGIAAWDAKRAYNSARPITAIRYVMAGQTILSYGPEGPAGGLRPVAGETWTPFQRPINPTPPHPDYVSGHSTYSTASAEVLRRFTGSDRFNHGVTVAARSLRTDPAVPATDVRLFWPTFHDAACEAGSSRIYGGIHFPAADTAGRTLGARVGAAVFEKAQQLWLGRV